MDKKEFLSLIEANQNIIHKICHLYRNSLEDREDLFQEITFQLWKSFPGFRGASKLSTWIYRIGLNTAMASFRKKQPAIEYTQTLPDYPEDQTGDFVAAQKEQLLAALQKLNDGEKAIITLYLEELNYQEIAEITGLTENNIGVKLNRIKTKLQKILNK